MERIYQNKLVKVSRLPRLFLDDTFISGKEMMATLGLKHKNAQYYALRYGIAVKFDSKTGRKMYSQEDTFRAKYKREHEHKNNK